MLHHSLGDAVRLGRIPRKMSELVSVPKKRPMEMHVWRWGEPREFIESLDARADRFYTLYLDELCPPAGPHPGERG